LILINRVRELTGIEVPIIVGSHSLYAVAEVVPNIVRQSYEADFLLAKWGIEAIRKVNEEFGVTSDFYDLHGYHADALGLATVVLVPGWESRLQSLIDETGQVVAQCLEPHDAAVSKLIAGRPKDFQFIIALLEGQYIQFPILIERAALIQQTASEGALLPRLRALHDHLRHAPLTLDLTPLRNLIQQLAVPNA
jgi:hypothetical protein